MVGLLILGIDPEESIALIIAAAFSEAVISVEGLYLPSSLSSIARALAASAAACKATSGRKSPCS